MKRLIFIFFLFSFQYLIFTSRILAYSTLFEDNFIDSENTLLSSHNSHWVFQNPVPGSSEWGEYRIHSNSAGDGSGTIYNIDKLNITLPNHFTVSETFRYNPLVSSDPNLAFMEFRLDNTSGSSEYLFRFNVNLPQNTTTLLILGPVTRTSTLGTFSPSGNNTISVEYNSGEFTAKINNLIVDNFTDTSVVPDHILISQSRFVPTSQIIHFELVDLSTPSAFPITHFSQRDPQWKDQMYDTANIWAPGKSSIERWGCSVTAASTVLDYYGIHSIPGGQSNDPGSLNTWLKNQPDGYIRQGALNWNAVSRLSKIMSQTNTSIPSLEYKGQSTNIASVQSKLTALQPVILEVPGHFVTAYQYHPDTHITDIVDPFYGSSRETLASYGNTFLSSRSFTPSHTNLGYIFVSSDQNITASLQGVDTFSHTVFPISDQNDPPFIPTSALPFNMVEFAQPGDSSYSVLLHRSSPGIGKFEIYTYDSLGNPTIFPVSTLFGSQDVTYTVSYHQNQPSTIQKNVTFESLREDVRTACQRLHECRLNYDGKNLLNLLDGAQKQYEKSHSASKGNMLAFINVLAAHKQFISPQMYQNIHEDVQLLLSQLY